MKASRTFAIAVLACLAAVFVPRDAAAQDAVQLDFRGGVSIPAGDLSTFVDPSPGFTIGVNVPVTERVSLRFDGGADIYSGGEVDGSLIASDGPDMSIARFMGGAAFHLVEATDESPFLVDANLGAGIGVLTAGRREFSLADGGVAIVDMTSAYFAGEGGLLLGYQIADQVDVFVSGQAILTLADEEDTAELGQLTTEGAPESLWSLPISAGLRFTFPR